MSNFNDNICDNFEKEFEELVTREGFIQSFFVHWVCKPCFKTLEGISFDEYGKDQKELIEKE